MKKVLLINQSDVIAGSIIETNVDAVLLSRTIATVQDVYLKPILGDSTYYNLIAGVYDSQVSGQTLTPLYSELLAVIKPYMVNKVVAEFIIPNQYKFSTKGLIKLNDNSANALENADVESVKNYYENISTTYKQDVIEFLRKNKLVEFNGRVDDDITSDASGWFLDYGDRHCNGERGFFFDDAGGPNSNPSSYINTFLTGGTYNHGVIELFDNQGGVIEIDGITFNDTYTTGGTYNDGVITLHDNAGNSILIDGLYTGTTGGYGLQAAISADNVLTQNNYIDANGYQLEFLNTNGFLIDGNDNSVIFQLNPDGDLQLYGIIDGLNQGTLHIDNYGALQLNSNNPFGTDTNNSILNITPRGNFSTYGDGGDLAGESFQQTFNISETGDVNFYSNILGANGNTLSLSKYGELQINGTTDSDGSSYYTTFQLDNAGNLQLNSIVDDNSYETYQLNTDGSFTHYAVVGNSSTEIVDVQATGDFTIFGDGDSGNPDWYQPTFELNRNGELNIYSSIDNNQNQTLSLDRYGEFQIFGTTNDSDYNTTFSVNQDGSAYFQSNADDVSTETLQINADGSFYIQGNGGVDGTTFGTTLTLENNGEFTLSSISYFNSIANDTLHVGVMGDFTLYGSAGFDNGEGFNNTMNIGNDGYFTLFSNNSGAAIETLTIDTYGNLNLYGVGSTYQNSTFAIGNNGGMVVWGDDDTGDGSNFQQVLGVSPNGLFVTYSNIDGNQNRTMKVTENGDFTLYGDGGADDGTNFAEIFNVDAIGVVTINQSYSLPNVDGLTGQTFIADGHGNVIWGVASTTLDASIVADNKLHNSREIDLRGNALNIVDSANSGWTPLQMQYGTNVQFKGTYGAYLQFSPDAGNDDIYLKTNGTGSNFIDIEATGELYLSAGASVNLESNYVSVGNQHSNTSVNGNVAFANQYATPTSGTTVTSSGASYMLLKPAGTLSTLTVAFPTPIFDGQFFALATSQTITTLTLSNATFLSGHITTLAAGGFIKWMYSNSANGWFQVA